MSMTNILQISPFAATNAPKSGGLVRIHETRIAYEQAGCSVSSSHIVTRSKDLRSNLDMQLGWLARVWRPHWGEPSNLGPIRQRWATVRSTAMVKELTGRLVVLPDIIHLEHPWTIRLACQLRDSCVKSGVKTKLVYGSHNIEHELYRSIWDRANLHNAAVDRLEKSIRDAEVECAQQADLCWAVSDHDAEALSRMGARNVVLAPNGCRTITRTKDNNSDDNFIVPYVVFVGGNYRPNLDGFIDWVQPEQDFLPAGTKVICIGSIKDLLDRDPRCQRAIASGQLVTLGVLSQEDLDRTLLGARAILLPISQGGGTNLKTAEALCSPRPVIATHAAMRGHEQWLNATCVVTASNPEEFRRAIVNRLTQAPVPDCARQNIESLHWKQCLSKAVQASLRLLPLQQMP